MRHHILRVCLIAAVMAVIAPRDADAGLLSWLSRLSGPGPFWGMDVSVCVKRWGVDEPTPEKAQAAAEDQAKPPEEQAQSVMRSGFVFGCPSVKLTDRNVSWFVTVGGAVAENNPLNYGDSGRQRESTAVRQLKIGTSLDYTAVPWLDVGSGLGVYYFAGPRFENFPRVYVEPVRATIRPFVFGRNLEGEALERRGWLLVSASWTILLGDIDGSTFGAPLDSLDERNESLLSLGASIDVIRLFKNFR